MLKKIKMNRIYNIIYSLLNVAFPLGVSIYVSRILLTDGVGKVTYAQTISQYFVILAFLGIPTYGTRTLSCLRDKKDELNKTFSELFLLNLISTLISSIIYYIVVFSFDVFENKILFYIIGIIIILNVVNVDWVYTAFEEFKYITIRNFIIKVLSFLAIILFVKSSNDFLIYAIISVVATCGNNIYNVIHLRKTVSFCFKGLNIKQFIKPVLILFSVNIAIEIYTLITTTAIGILKGDSAVGVYSYAVKIVNVIRQIIISIVLVSVPEMCQTFKDKNMEKFSLIINDTLKTILYIGLTCIVGYIILADRIIIILFGEPFKKAIIPSQLLSLTAIIAPIGYLLGNRVLLAINHEKKILYGSWIGAIVNILLSFPLIYFFDYCGAAVAYLLSEIFVAFIHIFVAKGNYKIDLTLKYILSLSISLIFMVVSVIFIKVLVNSEIMSLILGVSIGAFIFFVTSYITKNEIFINMIKCFRKSE